MLLKDLKTKRFCNISLLLLDLAKASTSTSCNTAVSWISPVLLNSVTFRLQVILTCEVLDTLGIDVHICAGTCWYSSLEHISTVRILVFKSKRFDCQFWGKGRFKLLLWSWKNIYSMMYRKKIHSAIFVLNLLGVEFTFKNRKSKLSVMFLWLWKSKPIKFKTEFFLFIYCVYINSRSLTEQN